MQSTPTVDTWARDDDNQMLLNITVKQTTDQFLSLGYGRPRITARTAEGAELDKTKAEVRIMVTCINDRTLHRILILYECISFAHVLVLFRTRFLFFDHHPDDDNPKLVPRFLSITNRS